MEISVIGVNSQTAPLAVVERASLSDGQAGELLRVVCAEQIAWEALYLRTGARVEIYLVAPGREDLVTHALAHVAQVRGGPGFEGCPGFWRLDGREAVAHAFRAAAGLDGLPDGDAVRDGFVEAGRVAEAAGTARLVLRELAHRAADLGACEAPSDDALDAAIEQFARWFESLQVGPTVERLRRHLASLGRAELTRRAGGAAFEEAELRDFTDRLCRRMLDRPLEFLDELSREGSPGEVLETVALIREMFGLQDGGADR